MVDAVASAEVLLDDGPPLLDPQLGEPGVSLESSHQPVVHGQYEGLVASLKELFLGLSASRFRHDFFVVFVITGEC